MGAQQAASALDQDWWTVHRPQRLKAIKDRVTVAMEIALIRRGSWRTGEMKPCSLAELEGWQRFLNRKSPWPE
jgi:hypothetical protein